MERTANRRRVATEAKVIRETLKALVREGFTLHFVDDGGENINVTTIDEALAAVTAVDEASVYFKGPYLRVYFVMGNEPHEVVCDMGAENGATLDRAEVIVSKVAGRAEAGVIFPTGAEIDALPDYIR